MKVAKISLLHAVVFSTAIVCFSTKNFEFDGGFDIEAIDSKGKLGIAKAGLTQSKRIKLASKLILLGKLLIKEARGTTTINQVLTEEEMEEKELESLARDVIKETTTKTLLKKLKDNFSQDAVLSNRRDSMPIRPRCGRCRNMFRCDQSRCKGKRSHFASF